MVVLCTPVRREGFGVTYEGLKHAHFDPVELENAGFGVTYEGLKPESDGRSSSRGSSFGVTYEGLKQCFYKGICLLFNLFWSYL